VGPLLFDTMPPVNNQNQSIYFLSDAHLGSGPNHEQRLEMLLSFLKSITGKTTHVYILGDLFDFWFEYRHAIPKAHFQVLRSLADLIDGGSEVFYLGGNHDFWCGSYLGQEVGLQVHQHPITVSHQGRKIFLAHGDGIGPGDTGYRILKAILRHPICITLYRTIHPDLGIPFAYKVSKTSREYTASKELILARLTRHLVAPQFAAGANGIIMGHIHTPMHFAYEGNRDFLIAGDWLTNFTYVRLEGGQLSLWRYRPEGDDTRLEADPRTLNSNETI
jgi:UDP-2,3-diacylglucosamine hydrolase